MINEKENEKRTPEEQEEFASQVKPLFAAMRILAGSRKHLDHVVDAWSKGKKTPSQQALEEEFELSQKSAVALHQDQPTTQPPPPPKAAPQAEMPEHKPSRRGTKYGADLISERWASFEQAQAKALDGIRDMESRRDESQAKLDAFNEKHGDYLNQSVKQATGGDLKRMEHYKKLQEQQQQLVKGLASQDKSLDQARNRYQRDHHEFHADSWNKIRERAEIMGQKAFIPEATKRAELHKNSYNDFNSKLPGDESIKHTKSITAQKVEEHERLSDELKQRAKEDPSLQKDIDQGLEQVKKIGEETEKRRVERQEGPKPDHKQKHKQ